MPVAERVRALEARVPQLQQDADLNNGLVQSRQASQSDQHSLIGRVEALEGAVDVLLTVQVCHPGAASCPSSAEHTCCHALKVKWGGQHAC